MRPSLIIKTVFKTLLLFFGIYFAVSIFDSILTGIFSISIDNYSPQSCAALSKNRSVKLLRDPSQFAADDEDRLPAIVESYRTSGIAAKIVKILTYPIDVPCRDLQRFGISEPGGHDGHFVCMEALSSTEASATTEGSGCLVYSFGVGYDFSFEDQIIRRKCDVHSFDPSMVFMDHVRGEGVYFHRLGLHDSDSDDYAPFLGGFVKEPQIWRVRTLNSIISMLGHENRTISVLKVDIEGSEWPLVEYLLFERPELLKIIGQFIVEWHIGARQQRQIDQILSLALLFRRCSGFSLVYADYWRRDSSMHCFLTTFVNSRLLHNSFY